MLTRRNVAIGRASLPNLYHPRQDSHPAPATPSLMELASAPPIDRTDIADAVRAIARTGDWRAPGAAHGIRGAAVDYLVGRLAAELRALAALVDRSRSALDVEERALGRTVAAIRRQASAADAARSAAAAL